MRTLVSPSLQAGFKRLHAQREAFFPMIEDAGMAKLWRCPTETDWAIGDTLLHLCKTIRIYRVFIAVSWPALFPVAWLLRSRRFERGTVDIFAENAAAGRRMKATRLLVPYRPDRLPSSRELREQLEVQTDRMEDLLAGMAEGVAGHFRIFDPGVGSPNLIQRLQLLAFHERHHFKIIERLLARGTG